MTGALHRRIEKTLGLWFGTYSIDTRGRPWLFFDKGDRAESRLPSFRIGRFGFYAGRR